MWCERYSECNIVFAGDFNADRSKSDAISTIINNYIADHSLRRSDVLLEKDSLITYHSIALNQRSRIDYVLTPCSNMVTDFDVLDLYTQIVLITAQLK